MILGLLQLRMIGYVPFDFISLEFCAMDNCTLIIFTTSRYRVVVHVIRSATTFSVFYDFTGDGSRNYLNASSSTLS